MDSRQQGLQQWVGQQLAQLGVDLEPGWSLEVVSGDASFRRYFRVRSHNLSWIAVDAPPDKEDSHPFVAIAHAWQPLEIHVPVVHAVDFDAGYMLLSDLGDELYLPHLNAASADELYRKALLTLTHIQQCRAIGERPLPPYDKALLQREVDLFSDWFIPQLLQLNLSEAEQHTLQGAYEVLIGSALEQPQVCVHRDYHSRNLMLTESGTPGVIDFQDAVWGPLTYDLVSLLRDCYIDWPDDLVRGWALNYATQAVEAGIIAPVEDRLFLRWFDLMGMQRHLKAVGIFARLLLRDGKPGYLDDIPRTFGYLLQVSAHYPELQAFRTLLVQRVLPAMQACGHFADSALERLDRLA
ncbi:MAG TPA: phosphotransferase [Motiliproteus sp.]